MQLGFIGAGRLAAPMIANLADDGHQVRVWNRSREKAASLAGGRVRVAESAAAACTPGGIVLSCLADDAALEGVLADGSVIEALGLAGVHVSLSTVSAPCAERLAAAHETAGVHYLAAPLIGRPEAVAARAQSWLLAGPESAKVRVRDLLEALGRRVFDFGAEPAAANLAKINFNFLIAAAIEALAESFAVTEKAGLDPRAFYDMVVGTAFGCPLYENYGRILVEGGWNEAAFRLVLGLKDVRLATATAADHGARMRLGELLEARYGEALAHGHGEKDWTAIALEVRAECGLDGR